MKNLPIMIANWKMHKTAPEARHFIGELIKLMPKVQGEVWIAPPFTAVAECAKACQETQIAVGAQNLSEWVQGAYTGEVSGQMLKDSGAEFVLIGHSERRKIFRETEATVKEKIHRALENQLTPVLCVGETHSQRESGQTQAVLEAQIRGALTGFEASALKSLIIAYEPVWAIGTGVTASPQMAQETHNSARLIVSSMFGAGFAQDLPFLYGGSVKPDNVAELMAQGDINGALIGGASLEASSFAEIIKQGSQS
ncbi:MAG: triose-phosphate isomerase [Simkaniaceae bacterium]|nr:triose-phosphate isomerase [Simkaniaceae bacterium]